MPVERAAAGGRAGRDGGSGRSWRSRLLATALYLSAVAGLGLVALTGSETATAEPITQAVSGGPAALP